MAVILKREAPVSSLDLNEARRLRLVTDPSCETNAHRFLIHKKFDQYTHVILQGKLAGSLLILQFLLIFFNPK